MQDITK